MAIRKFEHSSVPTPLFLAPVDDGRYIVEFEGGKLTSATRLAANVCVMDSTDGKQMSALLRASVPAGVWSGDDMSELVVEQYDKLSPGHIALIDLEADRECRYVNSPLNVAVLMKILSGENDAVSLQDASIAVS